MRLNDSSVTLNERDTACTMLRVLLTQDGGFGLFEGQAKRLEREMAEAEREAGGNKDELKLSIARVRFNSFCCLLYCLDSLCLTQQRSKHRHASYCVPLSLKSNMLCLDTGSWADATLTLRRCSLLQAEKDHKDHIPDLINMNKVVRMCEVACDEQWRKYDMVFESELRTASDKFYRYMYRRGHMVRLSFTNAFGALILTGRSMISGGVENQTVVAACCSPRACAVAVINRHLSIIYPSNKLHVTAVRCGQALISLVTWVAESEVRNNRK